eukprot:TRINITY_DN57162_c0_g1_i1.p2 TRINITY_DN57162_c0_g1~~TRINITY_DN57162_c0_g1_i1.p2  ORF type:complete len:241 (-),score=49.08 TRINITY_DN57162_c0_g1_i1:2389-3060(-)
MPKKFQGTNSKAETARARKAEAASAIKQKKAQEAEDALWEETDKKVLKKQSKQADKEKKQQEKAARQDEKRQLEKQEEEEMKKTIKEKPMTLAQVQQNFKAKKDREAAAAAKKAQRGPKTVEQVIPEENINHIVPEEGEVSATTIDEAIGALSSKPAPAVDQHPERRMKAAHLAYEERMIPIIRKENPGLKLSQIKAQIFKEWQKSPENPLVQAMMAKVEAQN